ncbi:unnamed protein product, partial [Rotaria sp. Silwood1]
REKFHRSLVIQFVCFYTLWAGLWSPNIIVYQASINQKNIIYIVGILNYIDIVIDPIIIAALDFRLWHTWRKNWIRVKNTKYCNRFNHWRIQPSIPMINTVSVKTSRAKATTM